MQPNLRQDTATKGANLETLQECLQSELSAVETYELALKSIDHVALHHTCQEILDSHARRTERLTKKIERLGGTASKSTGIWGAFAKAMQMGADLFGERTAIAALEEGEDRGLKLYTSTLRDCDATTRRFIEAELLPAQRHTHDLCRQMKAYMNSPS